jgi:hypothetical protein
LIETKKKKKKKKKMGRPDHRNASLSQQQRWRSHSKWLFLLLCLSAFMLFSVFREAPQMEPFSENVSQFHSTYKSILHHQTPIFEKKNADSLKKFQVFSFQKQEDPKEEIQETLTSFPMYVTGDKGWHLRLENTKKLFPRQRKQKGVVVVEEEEEEEETEEAKLGHLLVVLVFNNAESWGKDRSVEDFFRLLSSFEYPSDQLSITLLTSSFEEFQQISKLCRDLKSKRYPLLNVIFRNDFLIQNGNLQRENRHADSLQKERRRMLARYRNYALSMTLEAWHEHVVWIDADVHEIPSHLMKKMVTCEYLFMYGLLTANLVQY